MKLVSIETIPGQDFEVLGLVKGTIVNSKNVGRDLMAGLKTIVGGEIVGYTEDGGFSWSGELFGGEENG